MALTPEQQAILSEYLFLVGGAMTHGTSEQLQQLFEQIYQPGIEFKPYDAAGDILSHGNFIFLAMRIGPTDTEMATIRELIGGIHTLASIQQRSIVLHAVEIIPKPEMFPVELGLGLPKLMKISDRLEHIMPLVRDSLSPVGQGDIHLILVTHGVVDKTFDAYRSKIDLLAQGNSTFFVGCFPGIEGGRSMWINPSSEPFFVRNTSPDGARMPFSGYDRVLITNQPSAGRRLP